MSKRAWEAVHTLEGARSRDMGRGPFGLHWAGKLPGTYKHNSVRDLMPYGRCGEINIVWQGGPRARITDLPPVMSHVVLSMPDMVAMFHGRSKVSVIDGGSLVHLHTGCCNSDLCMHMGIAVLENCRMMVRWRVHGLQRLLCAHRVAEQHPGADNTHRQHLAPPRSMRQGGRPRWTRVKSNDTTRFSA